MLAGLAGKMSSSGPGPVVSLGMNSSSSES